jgi:hypothetical protein
MTTPNHRWGIRYSSDSAKNLAYIQTQYTNDNDFAQPGELFLNENLQEVYYVDHSDDTAKKLAGVWAKTGSDAYYSAGKVGIGLSAPTSPLEVATTWNDNTVDQYALKLSITDTSSGAGSKPLEVAVDGSSKLSLSKAGDLTVAGKVNLPSQPPANAGSAGVVGDVAWDSGFIYICVANNTWKRAAISTWV